MMRMFIFSCSRYIACTVGLLVMQNLASQQDTAVQSLNMDAAYDRPFITVGKSPVAIGGYLEANSQFAQTDGVNEGVSFQFRRLTLFMSSTISRKIKFLSEIEFEDGTKEINIEFAALDVAFHSMVNWRAGIVMNPIGAYNQNHDGPRWDFIDRPLSARSIIPTTLSNVGFGFHGKQISSKWIWGYEVYLTNGFDDAIISNEESRTSLAAGKSNPEKFEESHSGSPMLTAKLALRNRKMGELGISFMRGVYNKWKEDGIELDDKRLVSVLALDFNSSLWDSRIHITGEVAKVMVDIPSTYSQQFGTQQFGAFVDIIGTIAQKEMFGWPKAKLHAGIRLEYVDYNQDHFLETGDRIGDDVWAIVPAVAFRPTGTTVFRFNYRYERQRDFLGNTPAKTGKIQFGVSAYF